MINTRSQYLSSWELFPRVFKSKYIFSTFHGWEQNACVFIAFCWRILKVLFVHSSWVWVEQLGFCGVTANMWAELNSISQPIGYFKMVAWLANWSHPTSWTEFKDFSENGAQWDDGKLPKLTRFNVYNCQCRTGFLIFKCTHYSYNHFLKGAMRYIITDS